MTKDITSSYIKGGSFLSTGYAVIEDLLPHAGYSVYKLVRMASNRALELADGRPKLIDILPTEKTATIALEEIRRGKVILKEASGQYTPKQKKEDEQPAGLSV